MKFEDIPMFEFLSDSRTPVVERNFYLFLAQLDSELEQKKFIDAIQGKGVSLFKFPTWKEYKKDRLPTYKDLANYLGVSESAIKQYNPKKRELMLIGLANKKNVID